LDLLLPDLLAAGGVEREHIRLQVAEVDDVAAAGAADARRAADAAIRLERPVGAAGRRIERVDRAVVAAYEDTAGDHRRVAVSLRATRKSECPFELQLRHVGGGDARLRLVA